MTKRLRLFANPLILLALLLAACSPAAASTNVADPTATQAAPAATETATPGPTSLPPGAPDLSGETITIYHLCASTGELAAFNFAAIWAAQDMVASINAAGGVFGAQLDLQLIDTQSTAAGTEAAYTRLLSRDEAPLILIICDATTELTLAPLLARDDIPALGPGLAPQSAYSDPGGALFAFRTPVPEQFAAWLDYLSANWNALKPVGAGDEIRLAVIGWPAEQGGALNAESLETLAADYGIEVVQQADLEAERDSNVYDLIYAARDQNANAIYLNTRTFGSAELLNALSVLGLRERFVVAGPDLSFDGLGAYLLQPANLDGSLLTSSSAAWSDVDDPAIAFAQVLFDQNEREAQYHSLAYLHTLAAVDIARHAMERVVLADGLDGLEAASLRSALFDFNAYDVLGGLYALSYSRDQRYPALVHIYQFAAEGGEYILLQDASE